MRKWLGLKEILGKWWTLDISCHLSKKGKSTQSHHTSNRKHVQQLAQLNEVVEWVSLSSTGAYWLQSMKDMSHVPEVRSSFAPLSSDPSVAIGPWHVCHHLRLRCWSFHHLSCQSGRLSLASQLGAQVQGDGRATPLLKEPQWHDCHDMFEFGAPWCHDGQEKILTLLPSPTPVTPVPATCQSGKLGFASQQCSCAQQPHPQSGTRRAQQWAAHLWLMKPAQATWPAKYQTSWW